MKRVFRLMLLILSVLALMAAAPVPALAKSDSPIVVTMGDSYASGEGIEPYYGQNGQYKYWDQDWAAHRSSKCWSSLLSFDGVALGSVRAVPSSGNLEFNMASDVVYYDYSTWTEGSWFNVSTSASMLQHLYKTNEDGYKRKEIHKTDDALGEISYTAMQPPQITVFDYIDQTYGEGSVDYVTMTAGGYDADLPYTVLAAALSSTSNSSTLQKSLDSASEKFETTIRSKYIEMFRAVREAAGPQAKIIFVGYTPVFSGATSNTYFNQTEMKMIDDKMLWYDYQMQELILELNDSGFDNLYYVSLFDVFKGHGAYSSDSYLYPLIMPAQAEDVDSSGLLGLVSLGSFHPNAKGSAAIAAKVQSLISEIDQVEAGTKAHVSGLARENGSYCYYNQDGTRKVNAWLSALGTWFYLGEDGTPIKNSWKTDGGKQYYLDGQGMLLVNAWLYDNGMWHYFNSDGSLAKNAWVKSGGVWYYVNDNGEMLSNAWVKSGGVWYYLGAGGKLVANGWVKSGSDWYYMGASGALTANSWVKYNGKYYYMGSNGKMLTNGWVKYGGKYYYVNGSGNPVTNTWVKYGGSWYYFNSSGVCTRQVAA